jgi:hypothetical protein
MKNRFHIPLLILIAVLFLGSCQTVQSTSVPTEPPDDPQAPTPSSTPENTDTPSATATEEAPAETGNEVEETPEPLPASPQEISFTARDGEKLQGAYYPAAVNPAPVVVLLHWFPGDQNEWVEIAYWIQNRGLEGNASGAPWLDQSWFPEFPPNLSLGVFTFTFRGCEGGCQSPDPEGWLLDAQAALEKAAELPGVNPEQIVAIGASIGADGAIDGCAWWTEQDEAGCQGALSLSPGNYLNQSYEDMVKQLGQASPARQVWCFYDENETISEVCQEPSGDHFRAEGWSDGNLHGMHMLNPDLAPNPLGLFIDFFEATGVTQP